MHAKWSLKLPFLPSKFSAYLYRYLPFYSYEN
jgi:hypothetical protein